MALTINTNMSSLIAQANLSSATNALNTSIERMTTGYKINHAKDNAAGYSIATNWKIQLSSLDVAADNTATGIDMLTTAEDTYGLILDHIQRIRDLTEQAANGTFGADSLAAIQKEMEARFNEIERITNNSEFNGIKLADGTAGAITFQVGINNDANSQITLAAGLFIDTNLDALKTAGSFSGSTATALSQECSGYTNATTIDHTKAIASLAKLDTVIDKITASVTDIGAAQNRLESASEAIAVQSENITSSLSTIKDADVAEESSNYIKAQILQQAAATLLSTANQTPSIALSLI